MPKSLTRIVAGLMALLLSPPLSLVQGSDAPSRYKPLVRSSQELLLLHEMMGTETLILPEITLPGPDISGARARCFREISVGHGMREPTTVPPAKESAYVHMQRQASRLEEIYRQSKVDADKEIDKLLEAGREGSWMLSDFILPNIAHKDGPTKPRDPRGGLAAKAIGLRSRIWKAMLAHSFGGQENIRRVVHRKRRKRERETGKFKNWDVLPDSFEEIQKMGHLAVEGYLPASAVLQYGGRFWGQLTGFGDTNYTLEIENGLPVRIWLERYHAAIEFATIERENGQRSVVRTHLGVLSGPDFENLDEVIVVCRLDSKGNLSIGGGPPSLYQKNKRKGIWARFGLEDYAYERVELVVKKGLICECRLVQSGETRSFTRVWSKKERRFITSYYARFMGQEAENMNPDDLELQPYTKDQAANEEHPGASPLVPTYHASDKIASEPAEPKPLDPESAEYRVWRTLDNLKRALSKISLWHRVRDVIPHILELDKVIDRLHVLGYPVIEVCGQVKLWTTPEVQRWQSIRGIISRKEVHQRLNWLAVDLYPGIMDQTQYDGFIVFLRRWAQRIAEEEELDTDPNAELTPILEFLKVKPYFLLTGLHKALPRVSATNSEDRSA